MPEPPDPIDNPLLMAPGNCVLMVIDMQEKLAPVIDGWEYVVWNIRRLLDGAKILDVPALGTEHYPQGLGKTVSPLAEKIGELPCKLQFSGCGCGAVLDKLQEFGRSKILLAGVETHVCVQQTALDLLALGYEVYLAADAVSSRYPRDTEIALRRMDSSGVTLTTTEAALFEWCRVAGTPQFKQIGKLVREEPPL